MQAIFDMGVPIFAFLLWASIYGSNLGCKLPALASAEYGKNPA